MGSLGGPEEDLMSGVTHDTEPEGQPATRPSRSTDTAHPFLDHVMGLSEYDTFCFLLLLCTLDLTHMVLLVFLFADQLIEVFRGHQEGANP